MVGPPPPVSGDPQDRPAVPPWEFEPGTRVVIRYRIPDGRATDAVGWVSAVDATHVVVATKRGLETVARAEIIAAKRVPPPPG